MHWDRFTESVIKAAKGQKGIIEPSYVYLPGIDGGDAISKETGVDYFSVPIELGVSLDLVWTNRVRVLNAVKPLGAEKAQNVLSSITLEEKRLLEACKTGLKGSIEKGIQFIAKSPDTKWVGLCMRRTSKEMIVIYGNSKRWYLVFAR